MPPVSMSRHSSSAVCLAGKEREQRGQADGHRRTLITITGHARAFGIERGWTPLVAHDPVPLFFASRTG